MIQYTFMKMSMPTGKYYLNNEEERLTGMPDIYQTLSDSWRLCNITCHQENKKHPFFLSNCNSAQRCMYHLNQKMLTYINIVQFPHISQAWRCFQVLCWCVSLHSGWETDSIGYSIACIPGAILHRECIILLIPLGRYTLRNHTIKRQKSCGALIGVAMQFAKLWPGNVINANIDPVIDLLSQHVILKYIHTFMHGLN